MRVWLGGFAVFGPGFTDPFASRAILAGARAWTGDIAPPPPPALLPANERRRAGLPVRLALTVAEAAVREAGLPLDAVRGVFGSANGEGALIDSLLRTLASDAPTPSPTAFHNSVHNAVAGYWAMGASSRHPVTCLGGHDATAGAALLKAAAETLAERAPVLLCLYDAPLPPPLHAKRPTAHAFAAALVLLPSPGGLALDIAWNALPAAAALPVNPALHALARANPAARLLPVLELCALGAAGSVSLACAGGSVCVAL